jgi:signal transduction histidine kinase
MKVLLVEDDPLSFMLLEEQIRLYGGYDVTACDNPAKALAAYQHIFSPLIVTDLNLPGMDGLDFCRYIRALPQGGQSMILVVTARDTPEDLQAVLDAGADDYLVKPVSQEMLNIWLTIIERQLQLHAQRRRDEEQRLQLESQLRQSQRLEALGILAGGIAHDFNNILGTIMGYTELLLTEHAADECERDYLEQVYRAGERAADLIQQILTFSHAQEHALKPTAILPIIQEALQMMRAAIPANILIRQHLMPHCHPIMADATQIHQVLVNLCTNAAYAMRDQGGILDIALEEVTYTSEQADVPGLAAGLYVRLTVRDTGRGITPEIREHIFEPFFTTKEVGQGVGLGLSVVHGIVKSHKGAITVASEPDQGTTFQIVFPITEEAELPTEPAPIVPAKEDKGHIMIVEDERMLGRVYEIALTKLGYSVTRFKVYG